MAAADALTYEQRLAQHQALIRDADAGVEPSQAAPKPPKKPVSLSEQLAAFEDELPYIEKRLDYLAKKEVYSWPFVVIRKRNLRAALETFRAYCLEHMPQVPTHEPPDETSPEAPQPNER